MPLKYNIAYIWHSCIWWCRIELFFLVSPTNFPSKATKSQTNYKHSHAYDNCNRSNDFNLSTPFLPWQITVYFFTKVSRSVKILNLYYFMKIINRKKEQKLQKIFVLGFSDNWKKKLICQIFHRLSCFLEAGVLNLVSLYIFKLVLWSQINVI